MLRRGHLSMSTSHYWRLGNQLTYHDDSRSKEVDRQRFREFFGISPEFCVQSCGMSCTIQIPCQYLDSLIIYCGHCFLEARFYRACYECRNWSRRKDNKKMGLDIFLFAFHEPYTCDISKFINPPLD